MSHAIVRSIKVVGDKVLVNSTDNNVWPRSYHPWEMTYRDENNPFTGKEAAEVEILAGYEQGNFQGGSNKFTRALEVLRHMPEYTAFDWRGGNWEASREARDTKQREYYHLLKRALATKPPKTAHIITKQLYSGQIVYLRHRKGSSSARWYYDKSKATAFIYRDDAEDLKKYFTNSENWQIIKREG
jgi:hypothetical protein